MHTPVLLTTPGALPPYLFIYENEKKIIKYDMRHKRTQMRFCVIFMTSCVCMYIECCAVLIIIRDTCNASKTDADNTGYRILL